MNMKLSEILQAFHGLEACDRVDLICRMLRHCLALESRFLGTVLLDASKEHYKSQANRNEINANRVSHYKPFQESGISHEACLKLCNLLSVVHSDNRPVAEVIFQLLNDKKVLTLFEECKDNKVLQDFRLLYVMAVNHPALSFNQRQLLMYTFLRRMDLIFIEKCKYSFSGSFSNSVEKTLTGEVDCSKYPPEIQFSSPAPDAYITRCDVHSVYKRVGDKRYVYMIQVEWSDGAMYTVRRTYGDFFSFQTKLLDLFPEEGGQKGKKHLRLIPFLPGKNYQRFLKSRETAEKRLPELHRYSKELISLPEHIHRSQHVLEFFRPRPSDKTEEYPPLHKITTLYDVLESGKTRNRVFSEPLNGSPTHSPVTQPRGSPHLRFALSTSTDISPSTPSRVSQTLPPPAHTPLDEESSDSVTSVIPRRPTYPLNRKSAFNPVPPLGASCLSEDDMTSTATLVADVAGGISSGCHTPTNHLSSSSTSLTAPTLTPTSTLPPQQVITHASITKAPPPIQTAPSQPPQGTTQVNETSPTLQPYYTTESPLLRHPVAVLQHTQQPTGIPLTGPLPQHTQKLTTIPLNSTASSTVLVPVQPAPMLVANSPPCIIPHDALHSQGLAIINTREVIGSPTSPSSVVSSPHLSSSIRPINSPSPTMVTPNTPRGGYFVTPATQIIGVAQPYSPIPTYPYSPLTSPVPSPKMKMYGSYNAVNHPPSEHDSLMKWLKSLRLHKYHDKFDNVTFDEMCSMSVEQLESRGMTQGAAKKLFRKLEELKRSNFVGFRDMPVAPGMTRKPSTCSLPASLMMERGLTPSSSIDGFSPTGSTCSLDKFGSPLSMGRIPTPSYGGHRYSGEHHERQHSRSSCSSAVIEESDTAILRAVPFNSNFPAQSEPNLSTHNDTGVDNESDLTSTLKSTSPSAAKIQSKSVQPAPTTKLDHLSCTTPSPGGPGSTESSRSWADLSGSSESGSGRPEWAIMPANGEVKQNGAISYKHIQSTHPKISGGMIDSHHIIPIRTHPEQGNLFQQFVSQDRNHLPPKAPLNVPSRSRHAPINKRNSSEGYTHNHNHTMFDASTGRHKAISGNRNDTANWAMLAVRNYPNSKHPQQTVVHRVSPQYLNGGIKHHQSGGHGSMGVGVYGGGRLVNHGAEPGPVTCFNCGKSGHLGITCPANTMETNNPNTFHKKLENLVHSSNKSIL